MRTREDFDKKHYVYILIDPFDLKIRYIGCTLNPKRRRKDHYTNRFYNYNNKLLTWIIILKDSGTKPIFKVIAEFDNYQKAHSMECVLIKKCSKDLFNKDFNS